MKDREAWCAAVHRVAKSRTFTGWGRCIESPSRLALSPQAGEVGSAPDDDDDAVEDVIGVAQVVEEPEGGQLQQHLQGKHAGEDHIADLQDVGQLLGLWGCWGRRQGPGQARGQLDTHQLSNPQGGPGSATLAPWPAGPCPRWTSILPLHLASASSLLSQEGY